MATARIWLAASHRCRIRSQHPSSANVSAWTLLCSVEETWLAHYEPQLFLLKPCFLSSRSMTGQQLISLIYHPHTYSCITLFKFNHSVRPAAVSEAAHKWLLLLLPGASAHKKVAGREDSAWLSCPHSHTGHGLSVCPLTHSRQVRGCISGMIPWCSYKPWASTQSISLTLVLWYLWHWKLMVILGTPHAYTLLQPVGGF